MPRGSQEKIIKIPGRVTPPQKGFHSDQLLADLIALQAKGGADPRSDILALVKLRLTEAKALARKKFERGRLNGLETARLLAAVHDGIIQGLWKFAQVNVFTEGGPPEAEQISLCAVGGYGRGEMAPESDVDLLFLIKQKTPSEDVQELTEYILYMLWD